MNTDQTTRAAATASAAEGTVAAREPREHSTAEGAAAEKRPVRRRPGRPRGQDSAVVREQALRTAVDLIARQGFGATSMAQVAEGAGISPSGLAHHFPSKKALLGAVLAHRDAVDSDPMPPEGSTPWSAFDHLVHVAGLNMQRRQIVLLYATVTGEATTPDHPAHEWMLDHFEAVMESLTRCLRLDQEKGDVREDAPVERIARETVALMDGLQLQWLIDPSVDMAEILGDHVARLKEAWGTGQD
ncbi:TetR/AcrR family transcriptional regulator [Brachybacterium halotolerans subsp. kimchii]|uniref:TetR/AcrR family transcriptional regulator n=1 Tax=Brachybacterium halotolerans TaxID=2795215 RepID=UPI001E579E80|nr:TetR/AcrR family transcriptional regulator [Brachybacterium halotolerans]UEJ83864.1 TetR/AcrR family transcriptional regulator [Brachybacterium halotolerans subsp. kimchii]